MRSLFATLAFAAAAVMAAPVEVAKSAVEVQAAVAVDDAQYCADAGHGSYGHYAHDSSMDCKVENNCAGSGYPCCCESLSEYAAAWWFNSAHLFNSGNFDGFFDLIADDFVFAPNPPNQVPAFTYTKSEYEERLLGLLAIYDSQLEDTKVLYTQVHCPDEVIITTTHIATATPKAGGETISLFFNCMSVIRLNPDWKLGQDIFQKFLLVASYCVPTDTLPEHSYGH